MPRKTKGRYVIDSSDDSATEEWLPEQLSEPTGQNQSVLQPAQQRQRIDFASSDENILSGEEEDSGVPCAATNPPEVVERYMVVPLSKTEPWILTPSDIKSSVAEEDDCEAGKTNVYVSGSPRELFESDIRYLVVERIDS